MTVPATDREPAAAPPSSREQAAAPRGNRRFHVVLGAIALAGLAWRISYVIWQRGRLQLNGDAAYYHWQANDIAHGHWFIDPTQYRVLGRMTPSAFHPPGYVLYLAAVSKFIGTSETTHRIASTLLGAGAIFVLGVVARRIFGSDLAGWIAAFLAAAYAHLWINDDMLMSESLYVLAIALVTLTAYLCWDNPRPRHAALLGLAIALASSARPEALSLYVFLVIPLAWLRRERPWRARVGTFAIACVAGVVLLGPWLLYNLTRFDHPVLLSNGLGSTLLVANCDYKDPATGAVTSTYHGAYAGYWSIDCARDLDSRIAESFPPKRAAELQQDLGLIPGTDLAVFGDESTHEIAWRALGLHEMREHEGQLPKTVVLRVARMWDFYAPGENIKPFNSYIEGRGLWQSRLATFEYYPLLALGIGGLVLLKRRGTTIIPFVAVAASVTLAAGMTFGITRYRAGVDALLPVLAAGSLAWLFARARASLAARRAAP